MKRIKRNVAVQQKRYFPKFLLGMASNGIVSCGFTLIELLIVVLITGILASIALPQYQKAVDKARYATIKPIVQAFAEAEEAYYLQYRKYALEKDLDIKFPGGTTVPDAQNNYDQRFCSSENSEGYTYAEQQKSSAADDAGNCFYQDANGNVYTERGSRGFSARYTLPNGTQCDLADYVKGYQVTCTIKGSRLSYKIYLQHNTRKGGQLHPKGGQRQCLARIKGISSAQQKRLESICQSETGKTAPESRGDYAVYTYDD